MEFLCDTLVIFNVLKKVCFSVGTNLHPRYVPTSVSTYSYLHIDILHIDVYKEIFRTFHYFIFTFMFIGIYTYSASN